jgi:4-hydroxybenzoate polyprenyltransferase
MVGLRKYFEFVRFEHTVFALPFALASMAVAARETHGWPGWRTFLLVLAAMVCARTAAMGFNRIMDRKLDALNPRTAERHLPTGRITVFGAWWLVIGASTGLVVVGYFINRICFVLSPVALAIVLFYPFTKRFTDLSHFFLGLGLSVAPVGAWLAVRGHLTQLCPPMVLALAVVFWLVGFDIIYATQDYESDKALGLHSLPVRFGIAGSLRFAQFAHTVMAALLLGFGLISQMGWPYYAGWTAIVACLVHQHRLARNLDPVSVNAAFFRMNAVISVVLLAAVVADVVLR